MHNIKAKKILLLISDPEVSSLVQELCIDLSNGVDTAENCIDSIAYASETSWDLLIIYTKDHYSFIPGACSQIKLKKPYSQIIVISANTDSEFISECIQQGADDYITIPWNNMEFVARVRSTINRYQLVSRLLEESNSQGTAPNTIEPTLNTQPLSNNSDYLSVGDICMCPYKREVKILESRLKLTRTEYALLNYLLERTDRPCSSVELLNNVLGYEDENYLPSLHSHVSRLRRKINESRTTSIETIWCYGYRVLTKQSAA